MSTTIIRPKDRAEWLEHRKGGIGSSEAATILGLNPWETPYQLWRRKKGLDAPEDETFAMKAGRYLEEAVARFWADATGREIIKRSAADWLIVNNEREFLRVSPGRTFWIGGLPKYCENKGILECKTTQMSIDADDLPEHWFCQVQYLLGVSGLRQGSLAWLCSGREFGYRDIAFVPDFYGWMVGEVERFWVDNILGGAEPAAASAADVAAKYARHTEGKVIEASDEMLAACARLKEVRAEIAKAQAERARLETKIKIGLGDAGAIGYGGRTLATWKASKERAKFNSRAFSQAHPALVQEFTQIVPGARRFILK